MRFGSRFLKKGKKAGRLTSHENQSTDSDFSCAEKGKW